MQGKAGWVAEDEWERRRHDQEFLSDFDRALLLDAEDRKREKQDIAYCENVRPKLLPRPQGATRLDRIVEATVLIAGSLVVVLWAVFLVAMCYAVMAP